MKMKSISALALSTLLLFSCSKEDENAPGVGGQKGEETFVQVNLERVSASTRAYHGNTDVTAAESQVNSVRLYIFDDVNVLEAIEDFEAGENKKKFKLTTGEKTFLASANMHAASLNGDIEIGVTTLASLKTVRVEGIDNITVAANETVGAENIWMTSLEETTAEIEKVDNMDDAVLNTVRIRVGRAVAKVGVYFNPTTQTDGHLEDVRYKIHNNPNSLMLFNSYTREGYLISPYYNTVYSDNNYFANAAYLGTGLDNNNEYHAEPSYMMENSNLVPTQENATLVMVSGIFVPEEVYDADGQVAVAGVSGADFYRIRKPNGKFSDRYYSSNPSPAEFNRVVGDGNANDFEIVEYTAGRSFYGLWLYDRTKDVDIERYTIRRNTYWSVTITHVSGAGEPGEGGVVDPGEELNADTYMEAHIEIVPWDEVDHSGGI